MLKWCSYCQQFMGEVPEYDDLVITHGTCPKCHPATFGSAELDLRHARFLKEVQRKLWSAGHLGDVKSAASVIHSALNVGVRPVDVLIGMIAPLLYQIGEEWKKGALSVEGEHRFTSFCENVFDLIVPRLKTGLSSGRTQGGKILLMNAPGNRHTLAIRILALWLTSRGRSTEILGASDDTSHMLSVINANQVQLLLISMAMREQYDDVEELARCIATIPEAARPKVFVGGYAVKSGLVSSIRGADLLADISLLP